MDKLSPTPKGLLPGDHIGPIRFRKRPVEIQAMRWSGRNLREVIDFTGLHASAEKWTWEEYEAVVANDGLKIFTLEGPLMAAKGDWIIKGVKGEFYPCKPDVFAQTYVAVGDEAPSYPWHPTESDKVPLSAREPRVAAVIEAARMLSDSLNGGFVRCTRCGEQEDTTDLDFAPDLRKALAELDNRDEYVK